jgi:hypothetical protein
MTEISGYRLEGHGVEFEYRKGQDFSLLNAIQTGSAVHTASYPMGTGGSFTRGKAAGT